MDEWLDLECSPGYQISDNGEVRHKVSKTILAQRKNNRGLNIVTMYVDGKHKTRAVHRLVAENFLPSPQQGYIPWHKDGNKNNNHVDNLCWKNRRFVWKMTAQEKREEPLSYLDNSEVWVLETDEVFETTLEAAKAYRMLEEHIIGSMLRHLDTNPTFLTRRHYDGFRHLYQQGISPTDPTILWCRL